MKRFLIILISAFLAFSLCSCSRSDGGVVVADGMKLAGNEAGNKAVQYSFTYPEEWTLARNDGVIELQYDCDESTATVQYATVTVLSFTLADSTQTAKAYWTEHEKQLSGIYSDYKLLDTEEYNEEGKLLDDSPAIKVKYQGALNGKTYINEQLICCRYGDVYLITLVVPEQFADKTEKIIAAVAENFKFVK